MILGAICEPKGGHWLKKDLHKTGILVNNTCIGIGPLVVTKVTYSRKMLSMCGIYGDVLLSLSLVCK